MPIQKDKAFEFADLSQYTLRERVLIRIADIVFFTCIKLIGSLTHYEVHGNEHFKSIGAAGKLPIYAFWHDRILLGTYFWRKRGIIVMTSKSLDGEYIARFIQRLGYGSIRGSSSRGGAKALVNMIKSMRFGHPMAFTVDGPRGPRYEAQPGPLMLAKKTGNPVMPFIVEPNRYWTVNSWDRLQIPRPFARALVIIGEPIYVDGDADDAALDEKLQQLQRSLDDLGSKGRLWRTGTP